MAQPATIEPPCEVLSPIRAAGFPPIITVPDPITILSGGPVQVHIVPTVAAGCPPINVVGTPGGITGPPRARRRQRCDADELGQSGSSPATSVRTHPRPFGLSLSKASLIPSAGRRPESRAFPFDKLRANGLRVGHARRRSVRTDPSSVRTQPHPFERSLIRSNAGSSVRTHPHRFEGSHVRSNTSMAVRPERVEGSWPPRAALRAAASPHALTSAHCFDAP